MRSRFQDKGAQKPSRRTQRLLWLASISPIGNLFYRYLRFGEGQPRVRAFCERNLFADPKRIDDEWMQMCYDGSRDSRSRFATLGYLVGTVPGGAWRDDRPLLASLSVPTQVLRGDTVEGAEARLNAFVESVPNPTCCGLIAGGRAVIRMRTRTPSLSSCYASSRRISTRSSNSCCPDGVRLNSHSGTGTPARKKGASALRPVSCVCV